MKYVSTRGGTEPLGFEDVILTGLAPDGGLFVPQNMPTFSQEEIASWTGLSYTKLALKVITPFVDGAVPELDLIQIIDKSYATFRHGGIAPLVQLGHNEWILVRVSMTHALTHTLTHSLTHSHTHSLTHSPTQSL